MVSSLIGPQYHDDQFWKFAESADDGEPNDFSVAMVPTFAADFEVHITFSSLTLTLSYRSIFSMLISMALRMDLSSMMDRTLDLLFSKGLRLYQLNCKNFQFW